MRKVLSAVLIALMTFGAGQGLLAAEARTGLDSDSWLVLQTLPIGTRLQLTMKDGVEIAGTLRVARGEAVDLDNVVARNLAKGQSLSAQETFHQSDVASLQIAQAPPRRRGVSWKTVMIAGAVVGALIVLRLISMTAE